MMFRRMMFWRMMFRRRNSTPPTPPPSRPWQTVALTASIALAFLLACGAGGCASSPAIPVRSGPLMAAAEHQEPWSFPGATSACKLVTPHYVLYTTIEDDEIVQKLGQLMEGGLREYRRMAPAAGLTDRPLACYLFDNRRQWAQFTQSRTGADAPIYLRINRGGYTAGDWYVAYFIGDLGTYSVAAHEGFHQFVARHFKSRPPPFLEEGMACTFEDVKWEAGLPRWDLTSNPTRLKGLRKTVAIRAQIPLADLCSMHAGQVVNTSPARIEAFYAQSWAFVRFCREAEGGKYRRGLENLMNDCAAGKAYGPFADSVTDDWHWDPASAQPLLTHYLGGDFNRLERDYRAYMTRLAVEAANSEPEFPGN